MTHESEVPMPTDLLVELRFRGCDCIPTLHDRGVLDDRRHHYVVRHDPRCRYLMVAVAHLN